MHLGVPIYGNTKSSLISQALAARHVGHELQVLQLVVSEEEVRPAAPQFEDVAQCSFSVSFLGCSNSRNTKIEVS